MVSRRGVTKDRWKIRGIEMPYRSKKQRAYMHIHHPEIAKRWDKKYGGRIAKKKKKVARKYV